MIEHGFVECLAGMFRRLDWKFDLRAHREHLANIRGANGGPGGGGGGGAGGGTGANGNNGGGGNGNGGVDMDEVDEFGDLPPLVEAPANANGNTGNTTTGNTTTGNAAGNANDGGDDGLREGEHGPGCTCCPQACLQVSLLRTLAAYCEKSTPGSTHHHLLLDRRQLALVQAGFERLFGTGGEGGEGGVGSAAEGKGAEEGGGSDGAEATEATEEEKEEALLEAAASLIFGPAAGESFAKSRAGGVGGAGGDADSDDDWEGDGDGRGSLLTELIQVGGG